MYHWRSNSLDPMRRGASSERKLQTVTLSEQRWEKITAPFTKGAPFQNAQEERVALAEAIALAETALKDPSYTDKGGWEGNKNQGPYEKFCDEERYNTQQLLVLFARHGLLKYHDAYTTDFAMRNEKEHRTYHVAARIIEKNSSNPYVVDSWVHDEGQKPEIMPEDAWLTACDQ